MFLWVWCVHMCICSWMCAYMPVGVCICDKAGSQCRRLSSVILHFNFRDKVFHWAWHLLICLDWWASRNPPIATSPVLGLQADAATPNFLWECWGSKLRSLSFCGKLWTNSADFPAPDKLFLFFYPPTVQVLRILGNIWDITLGDSVYRRGDTALWWKQPQKWIFQFETI